MDDVKDLPKKSRNMLALMTQREQFIIIGLTGRIGVGCSETAKVMSSSYSELNLPLITPGVVGLNSDEIRDKRILQRYCSFHWARFDIIKVRTIITSFLLNNGKINLLLPRLCQNSSLENIKTEIFKNLEKSVTNKLASFGISESSLPPNDADFIQKINTELELAEEEYKCIDRFNSEGCIGEEKSVSSFLSWVERKLELHTTKAAYFYIRNWDSLDTLIEHISFIDQYITPNNHQNFDAVGWLCNIYGQNNTAPFQPEKMSKLLAFACFFAVSVILPMLTDCIRESIKSANLSYTALYQKFGNGLRYYGEIPNFLISEEYQSGDQPPAEDIFAIPRKITHFIKVLRHPFGVQGNNFVRPVRVVIDSIKNPFEATYLRQRFSAFYLFSVSMNEAKRVRSITERDSSTTLQQIRISGWSECASIGARLYSKFLKMGDAIDASSSVDTDEKRFYQCVKDMRDYSYDPVRIKAYETGQEQYYLQDVPASIEGADVFITNTVHMPETPPDRELVWSIVRNVCLIMFPGLLLPTPIERCMQIAFSAKYNSGCLSRQVGAAVADKNYNVISIGWNDVPCGDISCARKNLVDLFKREDPNSYTQYELSDSKLRLRLEKNFSPNNSKLNQKLRGLPARYCFKDMHQSESNRMRTRAMHAEEKALSYCGNNAEGGTLFTTSSPCEMCSKNAKNHRIRDIYYIEEYPGISESQYSQSGDTSNRAEHHLFSGAIGRAYMQMYTPIMPHKDIMANLGAGWPWERD